MDNFVHKNFDESVNVTKTNPLKEFGAYILGIIALLGIIYAIATFSVEIAIKFVDEETEKKLWNSIYSDEFEESKLSPKLQKTQNYIQSLLDKIPKDDVPKFDYKIILQDSKEMNALAMPSGKIVIFTGLLNSIKSENGLVFILGHELGHFANKDHLRGLGRSLVISLILIPFVTDSEISGITSSIGGTYDNYFSRKQETKADDHGLDALQKLYGHVGGATEFFEYMNKKNGESSIEGYFSTHPVSQDRISHLQKIIKSKNFKSLETTPLKKDF